MKKVFLILATCCITMGAMAQLKVLSNGKNECSVEVYNVTVGSNSSLDIDFQEEAVLLHDVEIQAGSTLNIH